MVGGTLIGVGGPANCMWKSALRVAHRNAALSICGYFSWGWMAASWKQEWRLRVCCRSEHRNNLIPVTGFIQYGIRWTHAADDRRQYRGLSHTV